MKWKNKIVGHDEVAPDQLLAHPLNWRLHPQYQQETLADTISEIGYIKSVTVNRTTGRVLDGHLRVTLAMRNEEETIPVEYVELNEKEENHVLLTIDPISALAGHDVSNTKELLDDVENERIKEMFDKVGIYTDTPIFDIDEDQPRLDEKALTIHTCPECGHEFSS